MTRWDPVRIFIGYDSREPVAYHVLSHSILTRATCPVSITPLVRAHVTGFHRERGPTESTEFSLTRFMVPSLCDFDGYAVFLDCDMLCRVDIGLLWLEIMRQPHAAVLVCQHDYMPRDASKFLGQAQTAYPRKNWSSLMVFNAAKCRALTTAYVNRATGLELHRFAWLQDHEIGALPTDWNWLVGEYPSHPHAKMLHYTRGGPWFPDYATCDQADLWREERDAMLSAAVMVA